MPAFAIASDNEIDIQYIDLRPTHILKTDVALPLGHRINISIIVAVSNISDGVKQVKKQHLPSKICIACQRPFTWRKKWERDWENVKYCSEACRSGKR